MVYKSISDKINSVHAAVTNWPVTDFFPKVFGALYKMQQSGALCDIRLRAEDGSIMVHKVILLSCSQFFMDQLSMESVSETAEIYFEGVHMEQLKNLVHLMYKGSIPLSRANVEEKVQLFSDLKANEAVAACKEFIEACKKESHDTAISIVNMVLDKVLEQTEKIKVKRRGRPKKRMFYNVFLKNTKVKSQGKEQLSVHKTNDMPPQNIKTEELLPQYNMPIMEDVTADNITATVDGKRRRKPPTRFIETFDPDAQCKRRKTIYQYFQNDSVKETQSAFEESPEQETTITSNEGEGSYKTVSNNNMDANHGVDRVGKNVRSSERKVVKKRKSIVEKTSKDVHSKKLKKTKRPGTEVDSEENKQLDSAESHKKLAPVKTEVLNNEATFQSDEMDQEIDDIKSESSPVKKKKASINTTKCQNCDGQFEQASQLTEHLEICMASGSVSVKDKDGNRYQRKKCSKCKIVFPDHESFKAHRREQMCRSASRCYRCEICGQNWKTAVLMAGHMHSKHGVPFDRERFTVYECDEKDCGFETAEQHRLERHKTNCHISERPYVCELCAKGFKTLGTLKVHMNSHTRARLFTCPEKGCEQTFTQKGGMDRHIQEQHLKMKSALCHLCPYSCYQRSMLNRHLFKEHQIPLPKNYKQFGCEICDFVTFRSALLTDHMNAHNDNRFFECKICNRTYTSKTNLSSHMKYHTAVKMNKCPHDGCDYAAVQRTRLQQHIQLIHTHKDHKPFACGFCKYQSGIKGNLDKHLRMVHRIEPVIRQKRVEKINKSTPHVQGEELIVTCYSVPDNVTTLVISQEDIAPGVTVQGEIIAEGQAEELHEESQITFQNETQTQITFQNETLLETADMILSAVKQQQFGVEINEQLNG